MESNTLIEKICVEMSETSNTRSEIIKELLTALEPFIPKWVKVEDEEPNTGKLYLLKLSNGLIEIDEYRPYFFDQYGERIYVEEYMEIPDQHPYELLLNNLKDGK